MRFCVWRKLFKNFFLGSQSQAPPRSQASTGQQTNPFPLPQNLCARTDPPQGVHTSLPWPRLPGQYSNFCQGKQPATRLPFGVCSLEPALARWRDDQLLGTEIPKNSVRASSAPAWDPYTSLPDLGCWRRGSRWQRSFPVLANKEPCSHSRAQVGIWT